MKKNLNKKKAGHMHFLISLGLKLLQESEVHSLESRKLTFSLLTLFLAAHRRCVVMFEGHFGKPGVGKLFFFFFSAEEKSAFHIC